MIRVVVRANSAKKTSDPLAAIVTHVHGTNTDASIFRHFGKLVFLRDVLGRSRNWSFRASSQNEMIDFGIGECSERKKTVCFSSSSKKYFLSYVLNALLRCCINF